ncbi:hypothetical protein PG999_006459 [Apiospora kogelbergensis]|uniref:Peptidase inhibitor family I36 n=1 Tax=Apiospora kogelbergensis TaxID=1337665 RepID=A0AAW0QRC3_9PEZI
MLLPVALTLAASCAALSIPRGVGEARQAFLIPFVYSFSPSGRPGPDNSPYCRLSCKRTLAPRRSYCPFRPLRPHSKTNRLTKDAGLRKVNVSDAATNEDTQCKTEYGPCAWSGERPPEVPKPSAPKPAKCQNEDFKFWFSKFDSMRNFSLEVTHTYHDKDTGSEVVHTGDSGWINFDLRDRGFSFSCGGSGVCSMQFYNATDPLVAKFT